MKQKKAGINYLCSLVLVFLIVSPLRAGKLIEPFLDAGTKRTLLKLPCSLSGRVSLALRSKHFESINFFGGGVLSKYGFSTDEGLVSKGVWLRLVHDDRVKWASSNLIFNKPLDASAYNSVVLWVRADKSDQRFWFKVKDKSWKESSVREQSRTSVIPPQGLPKDKILQIVIPYSQFQGDGPVNFKEISELGFQFGVDDVGNDPSASIEILGLAFVRQDQPLRQVKYFGEAEEYLTADKKPQPENSPSAAKLKKLAKTPVQYDKVILDTISGHVFSSNEPALNVFFSAVDDSVVVYNRPRVGAKTISNLRQDRGYLATQSLRIGPDRWFELKIEDGKTGWVPGASIELTYAKKAVNKPQSSFGPIQTAASLFQTNDSLVGMAIDAMGISIAIGVFVFASIVFWVLYRKRNRWKTASKRKVIFSVTWPKSIDGQLNTVKTDKDIWNWLRKEKIGTAWIDMAMTAQIRTKGEIFHGLHYLENRIKEAKALGVQLIPSVGFVCSMFHYDTFLAHPELFVSKPVPLREQNLSDEELHTKHSGYFPIWVSPYWQKKHKLNQRVLVAYGRGKGNIPLSDSIQFNLASKELRNLAICVINKYAEISPAIRVEGVLTMLNQSVRQFWRQYWIDKEMEDLPEFWTEVISAVKKNHPKFKFIADEVGNQAEVLADMGFSFFENEKLIEILLNDIKIESVQTTRIAMSMMSRQVLFQSVYNLVPLLKNNRQFGAGSAENLLIASILSLLPGQVICDGIERSEFRSFLKMISLNATISRGGFTLLDTHNPAVLTFMRGYGKNMVLVVANLSRLPQSVHIRLEQMGTSISANHLYLFNDVLYGTSHLREIKNDNLSNPVFAHMGQDLRDSGLPLNLPSLSLKIISVNLTKPFSQIKLKLKQHSIS